MNFTIRPTESHHESVHKTVLESLIAFNDANVGESSYRPIAFAIEDERGQIMGGLSGATAYGWLFVELLFVPEALRGQGVGTRLIQLAEAEAIARGCHSAWLDTFEFQARGFYERLGYTCFGELKNYPTGSRFFMSRRLQ